MAINAKEFFCDESYARAQGKDTRPSKAITDSLGNVLFHPSTGGMMSPTKTELTIGQTLFRFAAGNLSVEQATKGGWWLEEAQFNKVVGFANHHKISEAVAARYLCLVPPEWSDMGQLIKATVSRPLLSWRGLGNSVNISANDGLSNINMPHHNRISSRRLFQLFIPGLDNYGFYAIQPDNVWRISKEDATRGFLYTV